MLKSLCLALTVAAAVSAPALAQDIHLTYGDLNPSQPADARTLERRIDTHARDWCDASGPATGSHLRDTGCVANVRDTLVASLPTATRLAYVAALTTSNATQLASADAR